MSVTLLLERELDQVVIGGSTSGGTPSDVRGLTSVDPRTSHASRVSTSHFGLHTPDFIEAEEGEEGHELGLVNQGEVRGCGGRQVGTLEEVDVSSGVLGGERNHLLDLDPALVTVL